MWKFITATWLTLRNIDAFLGHGRRLEAALAFVQLEYAVAFIALPKDAIVFEAFRPVPIPGAVLAVMFACLGLVKFSGLVLNVQGYHRSHNYRIVGASASVMLWTFVVLNTVVSVGFTAVMPWAIMDVVFSLQIIHRGMLGLPHPGAPGAI